MEALPILLFFDKNVCKVDLNAHLFSWLSLISNFNQIVFKSYYSIVRHEKVIFQKENEAK